MECVATFSSPILAALCQVVGCFTGTNGTWSRWEVEPDAIHVEIYTLGSGAPIASFLLRRDVHFSAPNWIEGGESLVFRKGTAELLHALTFISDSDASQSIQATWSVAGSLTFLAVGGDLRITYRLTSDQPESQPKFYLQKQQPLNEDCSITLRSSVLSQCLAVDPGSDEATVRLEFASSSEFRVELVTSYACNDFCINTDCSEVCSRYLFRAPRSIVLNVRALGTFRDLLRISKDVSLAPTEQGAFLAKFIVACGGGKVLYLEFVLCDSLLP